MKSKIIHIALPKGIAVEIDDLVNEGEFVSRNEALKFWARLVVLMHRRTHKRAEDYAYDEIKERLFYGKKAKLFDSNIF
ncbi:CopG family transcriptional regulator [Candidatus Woesearchaeota archaeon]|nr:CopG family transcriptional regulator [Candidatus Woesearchaeota archaeon]